MAQILGGFIEQEEGAGEYLKIGFHPSAIPIQQRWRNNGLSADFLADYLSTFFPGEDPTSTARKAEIKDAVSYIANELLENAMKFSVASDHRRVGIEMFLDPNTVTLYAVNFLEPAKVAPFRKFIERLLTEDAGRLYIEQLERNAENDSDGSSGLGFLTMLNDYDAKLAWKIDQEGKDGCSVTTMVQLAI